MVKNYLKIILIFWGLSVILLSQNLNAQNCWQALSSGVGINPTPNYVSCLAVYNGNLYAGGSFGTAGGISTINIAEWNGTSWSPLSAGIPSLTNGNGGVYALAVYNGELYAAGQFDSAGSIPANNIAKWNGSSWLAVGNGIDGTVSALAVYNGNLYAGGTFDSAGEMLVNSIAQWNGSSWSGVGGGFWLPDAQEVEIDALVSENGKLYAGGHFSTAGVDTVANNIAAWNDTTWSSLGNGIGSIGANDDSYVNAIAEYNGTLYVGGTNISSAGNSVSINNIGKWDGTSWYDVAGGIDNDITALIVYDGTLIVGGNFTTAGSTTVSNMAQWNGTSWSGFGGGIPGSYTVTALDTFNGNLYVGGGFNQAGTINALNIAEWTCATGISEIAYSNLVNIFPNPSKEYINITIQDVSKNPIVEVYDLIGTKIHCAKLSSEISKLDLSKMATGTYFYRISDQDGLIIASGKFIIQ